MTCSFTKSCPTLGNPVDCSMPGFPVLHYLLEFTQTHVRWVNDAIQNISSSAVPFTSFPQSFPASGPFPMSQLFTSGGHSVGASASASVPPVNIQDWFPLGLTGLMFLCSRDSKDFSPTPQFKSINSLALSLLYGPNLTSIHDYRKNQSLDLMDLCKKNDISSF